MKRWLILSVVVFLFAGCEKVNPVKKWTVKYRVYKVELQDISYRVNYVTNSGATVQKGPFNDFRWESEDLDGFEDGSYQRFEVETISGKAELQLQILVNGSVHEEGTKPEFEKSYEIESNL